MVSVPVTRPKWQQLRVAFAPNIEILEDGLQAGGCTFALPAAEGLAAMGQLVISDGKDGVLLPAGPNLRDGSWHRFRLQIFPDGNCGVAIDGLPLWRSGHPMDTRASYRLAIYGHSVDTKVLMGPVKIWQGVKEGVAWNALGTHRP